MTLLLKYIHELVEYDPETGSIFWKDLSLDWFDSEKEQAKYRKVCADKPAFTSRDSQGYLYGYIDGRKYRAHRIAWLVAHGDIPEDMMIDHKNRNKSDNRIKNLRLVTNQKNQWNKSIRKNKVGFKGVYYQSTSGKYTSYLKEGGKNKYLGIFSDPVEAAQAYDAAALQHFGSYAATNQSLGLL